MSDLKKDKPIPMGKVPEILQEYFGEERSRMTVYYWARVGILQADGTRIKLKTTKRVGKLYTTLADIREFVEVL